MTSFFPQSLWDLVVAIATKVFSNQGDVTVRLMIQYGQFSNLSEILSMFTASFGYIRSKLKEL